MVENQAIVFPIVKIMSPRCNKATNVSFSIYNLLFFEMYEEFLVCRRRGISHVRRRYWWWVDTGEKKLLILQSDIGGGLVCLYPTCV